MQPRWVCSLRVCLRVLCCRRMPLWQTSNVAVLSAVARPLATRQMCRGLRASTQRVALRVKRCVLSLVIAIYEAVTMTICAVNRAPRMPIWCSCVSMARSAI